MKIKTPNGKSFELKYDLFKHQIETFKFIQLNKKCFVFNQPGTGKTDAIVSNVAYNILNDKSKKVLIISTLATLNLVWYDCFKNHNLLDLANPVIVHGDKKEQILKENKHTTYIINPHGLTNLVDLLLKIKFDYIAVDEATMFKEVKTEKMKVMLKILKKSNPEFFILATGTPVSNGPFSAYGLLKLMYPSQYSNKANFRDLIEVKVKEFTYIPKPDCMDTLNKLMQPAICFKKNEVFKDLQDTVYHYVNYDMGEEQKKAFKKMHKEFVVSIENGENIKSSSSGIRNDKLLQIIGGSLKNKDVTHYFDIEDKLDKLNNILDYEVENKAIIFCSHLGQLDILKEALKDRKIAIINGSIKQELRQDIYYKFQNGNDIDIIIATPECMSHGLTLTSADSIIYFSVVESNETYEQANARISRTSQTRQPKIFHMYCCDYDYAKYMKNQGRMNNQDYFLSLLTEIN